jgi:hypothetical protein
MPSQSEETAGLAVMEQMIRGGVVVIVNIGGLTEVVGEVGLKFIPGIRIPSIAASASSQEIRRKSRHCLWRQETVPSSSLLCPS